MWKSLPVPRSPTRFYKPSSTAPLALLALVVMLFNSANADTRPPNFILILADDMGFGDVGAYGATQIRTPNIDSLAEEGIRLTHFYTSGNVCTPSRAGILTGRYPIRSGLADRTVNVGDDRGLAQSEVTLAEQLRALGYATALIGKWHLGDKPHHHPLKHGFDEFFGTLYSNDEADQALLRDNEVIEYPIVAQQLATSFIQESVDFINRSSDRPFFLMLSTTSPHKPLIPSDRFAGQSNAGAYGDVVEELDWGVGEVLAVLESNGQAENTVVIFTSDNGPFPQGSTGGLRGHKGTAWDGGYRVPFILRWPGQVAPGSESSALSINLDIMPTLINLAGGDAARLQAELDGQDLRPVLEGSKKSIHEVLYFFNNERIAALRTSRWRLMISDYPPWRDAQPLRFDKDQFLYTLLYDMRLEAAQQYDVSHRFPDEKLIVEEYLRAGRDTLEYLSTKPDANQYGRSYDTDATNSED